jgi:ferredoxin
MRVRIDYERCVGHARCIATCPTVFSSDDLGRAQVIGSGVVPEAEQSSVCDAARSCPENAVVVDGDDTSDDGLGS